MALPLVGPITTAVLLGAAIRPAAGQEAVRFSPPRADAAAYVGWFGANKSELDGYDDWYKGVWHSGLSSSYYWTEHLKTEVEFSGTTRGEIYEIPAPFDPTAAISAGPIGHEFATKRFALGQHYQFFHNAFFHPTIGAGVALTWETTARDIPPVFSREPFVPGQVPIVRQLQPGRTEGPETRLRTMAFAAAGFKAYFTQRGFFRSDVRVMFTDRVEDVTIRFGFGMDIGGIR
jgi:hypothetical protein